MAAAAAADAEGLTLPPAAEDAAPLAAGRMWPARLLNASMSADASAFRSTCKAATQKL